ncbi:MAG: cytochrome c biogenesis protein ResB [Candidatus Omnitrophica bacterium]|nr:cytochrome c biogenesis protein ResB [Candidatus Omnitrophota bacterium]
MHLLGSAAFTAVISTVLIGFFIISTSTEAMHGSVLSQEIFYNAWWFDLLVSLLWVNIFFSIVVRWPLCWRQTGFLITHVGILGILSGAFIIKYFVVDGQLMVAEGQRVDYFKRSGKMLARTDKKVPFCPLAVKGPVKLPAPILKVMDKEGKELLSYTLAVGDIPVKINIPQTAFEIDGLAFYPYAAVQGKGVLVNDPAGRMPNPAVSFDLIDSKGFAVHQFAFAFFPDFSAMHPSEEKGVSDLTFRLEAGKPEDYTASSAMPGGAADLARTDRSEELPFSLMLKDFRKIDYPGTMEAAAFESDVVLEDKKSGVMLEKTISMNHPLTYQGYKIFQMSYIDDGVHGKSSVFTVAKNPGIPVVYFSSFIACLGALWQFYGKRSEET